MKIFVNDIPEKGTETELNIPVEDFDLSDEGLLLKEPVALKVNLERIGSKVLIRGTIRTSVQLECSRCLEEFSHQIDEPFTSTFFPFQERPKDPDLELGSEDLDISYYDGKTIDLAELVREQILLSIPINPLCRPKCRGLCPECGMNPNEGKCACTGSKGDFRRLKSKDFNE
ncbi:DUF177 domain-containing protein [bacterium]|nr:DUF177 domain-containing protein [bacterium]